MFIQNDSVSKAFSSVLSRGQVRDAFLCHLLLVVAGWRVVGIDDVVKGGAVGGVLLSRFDGVRAGNLQQHLGLADPICPDDQGNPYCFGSRDTLTAERLVFLVQSTGIGPLHV